MQLLIFNEEFLVNVSHQLALITSLPFVHTARRSYRLNDPVRLSDWSNAAGSPAAMPREVTQTLSFRGRRSRNKVSVGEPAEGSLPMDPLINCVDQSSLWGVSPRSSHRGTRVLVCGQPPRRPVTELCSPHTRLPRRAAEAGACASLRASVVPAPRRTMLRRLCVRSDPTQHTQLLTTDILALATMKNAAKCDT